MSEKNKEGKTYWEEKTSGAIFYLNKLKSGKDTLLLVTRNKVFLHSNAPNVLIPIMEKNENTKFLADEFLVMVGELSGSKARSLIYNKFKFT